MVKGLIFGTLAFAAVFTAERQLQVVGKDIDRYNRIRAMSGDPPLAMQAFDLFKARLTALRESRRDETASLLSSLQSDLFRYVRISSM